MTTSPQPTSSQHSFTVICEDRWQVYYRLKELNIAAQCQGFRPLQASIQTATEAVQLWSIVRRISTPRTELAATLDKSWRAPAHVARSNAHQHSQNPSV
ncbi:MAG: Asr1405/Asl0597 family protein [Cyanobacteria bacterium P01_D01_bin.105]